MARGRIVRRSEGSWSIIYDLPPGADGKRCQKRVTIRGTKKEAEQKLTELLRAAHTGNFARPDRTTVEAFLLEWLETTARLRVSPKTIQTYEYVVNRLLVPQLGKARLDRLTSTQIEKTWVKLGQDGSRADGREGGLHPRTILHCHRVLHTALEAAVKKGLLPRNPCTMAEVPRQTRSEVQVLDEAQLRAVLAAARGTRLFIPILLMATTAMRRAESCALRWADVDFDTATLAVRRSLETTKAQGLRFKEPKSGKGRVIAIPMILVTELRRHKGEQAAHRLQVGAAYTNYDLVVANEDGSPFSPDALTHAFRDFIAKLDVTRVTVKGLRHTAATLLLGRNVSVKIVQDVLGHSTPTLTLGTYGHVLKAHQQEAARQMDDALGPEADGRKQAL